QLDLHLALDAARPLREDVEDQRTAVDDLRADRLLEVALLCGRQRVVEDDDVRRRLRDELGDLFDLAAADEGRRMGAAARLHELADAGEARGRGEPLQLEQGVAHRDEGTRRVDGHENRSLPHAGGTVHAIAQRKDIIPAPSTPSTAWSASSLAATRME